MLCFMLVAALHAATVAATIKVTGPCPAYVNITAAPAGTVLDFSSTPLVRLDLNGVSGVTVKGLVSTGAPFSALNVIGSNHVTLIGPRLIGPGTAGITVRSSDTVEVSAPWISGSKGDGVDIAGSTNVNVHDGACEANVSTAIHPDCVQLWSLPGAPVMHVVVSGMVAIGDTMGFDDWDATDLGGTDIHFINNTLASTWANCVGVLNTHGLVVAGSRCITLPGGTTGPTKIGVRTSPGAVVSGNTP